MEPAPNACAEARRLGLTVYQGTLEDVPAATRYDVITFNHVLEHLSDPVADLREAGRRLAPGGRIEAKTPNLAGLGFRLYGNCWYPFDAPRHLLHFTPATLRRAGERAGLILQSMHTDTQARFLCDSRHIRKSIGPGFLAITELETRRNVIAASMRAQERRKPARKWCKRFLHLPVKVAGALGRGETLRAVFVKARD